MSATGMPSVMQTMSGTSPSPPSQGRDRDIDVIDVQKGQLGDSPSIRLSRSFGSALPPHQGSESTFRGPQDA